MDLKDVEIFREGDWTDSAGITRTWTAADLARIAASYDPAHHEAPAVIGHPATNAPAYGWVERVKVVGDRLLADFKDLAAPFVQALKDGLYRKRSISVYPDGRLRHVGFLGAAAPAVPGLKDISFADGAGVVTYEFEAPGQVPGKEVDVDLAQALARIKELETQLADMKAQDQAGQHSAQIAALEAKVKEAKAEADKAKADFAEFKEGQAQAARKARVEALVATGRILPAEQGKILAFAEQLAKGGGEMDFAAGDGKTEKVNPGEAYLRDFEARAANHTGLLGEFATAERAAHGSQDKAPDTTDINKYA